MRWYSFLVSYLIGSAISAQRPAPVNAAQAQQPCQLMLDIARVVDSLGWTSDTARLKVLDYYNSSKLRQAKILWWNGRAFYTLRNPLPYTADTSFSHVPDALPASDISSLKKVRNAWAYFYRQSSAPRNVPDGMIEVWEFPSSAAAKAALHAFTRNYPDPYCNTHPQYFTKDELLVIGHARADEFSYNQRDVFKVLRARFRPDEHYPVR